MRALICLGLLALLSAGCGSSPSTRDAPRTVVLITIDTLRRDLVGAYGSRQAATPQLDALAARGALFERAIAAASSTIPSHATMMTGLRPRRHSAGARNGDTRLEGATTLAQRFSEAGWTTAAFISNAVLQKRSGLDAGFDHYDERLPDREDARMTFERVGADTVDAANAWLTAQPADAKLFVWVHLQDPHGPYTPPAEWIGRVSAPDAIGDRELPVLERDDARGGIPRYQALEGVARASEYVRRYAAEVAYADDSLGQLVAALGARGPMALLLTADHGESLGEGGYFFQHGHASTPELARVPLLVVAAGVAPQRRSELVGHVDVAPTLLELAGLEPLGAAEGVSLVPALRVGAALPERTLFCDAAGESSAYGLRAYLRAGRFGDQSAARALAAGTLQWQGSIELPDGGIESGVDPELERAMREYLGGEVVVTPASASEETLERLRALGYLGEEAGEGD